jgi:curved DNA-binding protein CbpA
MEAERDPYRVLGVDPSAEYEVIKAAHRALAKKYHTDISPGTDSQRRMSEINAAWAILENETTREAWDREHLASREGHSGHAPTAPLVWRGTGSSGSSSSSGGGGQVPSPTWERASTSAPVGPDGKPQWRRGPSGEGAAGRPPGQPVGTVLPFGRHIGWSLGEVARVDPGYLTWLMHRAEGARYKAEIEQILRGEIPTGSGPLSAGRPRWGKPG